MKPAGVFLLSLLPRAIYTLWRPPAFAGYYWDLSSSIRGGGTLALDGVRTARFEPLYPLFIAGARLITGDHTLRIQLLQCGVAALGAVWLFLAARALSNERVALIASVLFAVHPLLIRHAADLSDSAMTTMLLLLFVCVFLRARATGAAALAGVCLGLTALTRSVVLPLVVLAPALLLVVGARVQATVLAVAALLTVAPMLLRDHSETGAWAPARSGVNLFIGNSEYTAAIMPDHSPDILQSYADRRAAAALGVNVGTPDFAERSDPVLAQLAWEYMAAHPLQTLALKARNVWYFVSPTLVPSHALLPTTRIWLGSDGQVRVDDAPLRPAPERIGFALFSSVVLVLAVAGIGVRGKELSRDAILWCAFLTFAAVSSLYFPASRYGAPVAFVPLFYAAVALNRACPDEVRDRLTKRLVAALS